MNMNVWIVAVISLALFPIIIGYLWDLDAPRRLRKQSEVMEEAKKAA